jgi:hypothetical protein
VRPDREVTGVIDEYIWNAQRIIQRASDDQPHAADTEHRADILPSGPPRHRADQLQFGSSSTARVTARPVSPSFPPRKHASCAA